MVRAGRHVTILIVASFTSSCGGDGASGGGTIAPVVLSTPTPSPTPAMPSVTYMLASDFTRDRSFTAIGYQLAYGSATPSARLDLESSSIGFDFTASTRTYQARYNAASITAVTQAMTSYNPPIDQTAGPAVTFSRSPFILGYDAAGSAIASSYFGVVTWRDVGTMGSGGVLRYLLFGAKTVAGDLPATGVTTKAGSAMLTSTFAYGGGGGDASVVIDFAAHTITGTTLYYPAELGSTGVSYRPPPAAQTVTFTGTLDASTGRVSGTATNTVNGATGSFEGAFYGPHGVEIGLLVTMTGADGTIYYGIIGARS